MWGLLCVRCLICICTSILSGCVGGQTITSIPGAAEGSVPHAAATEFGIIEDLSRVCALIERDVPHRGTAFEAAGAAPGGLSAILQVFREDCRRLHVHMLAAGDGSQARGIAKVTATVRGTSDEPLTAAAATPWNQVWGAEDFSRRLDDHPLLDRDHHWPILIITLAVSIVFLFLWEVLWLRTTMFSRRARDKLLKWEEQAAAAAMDAFGDSSDEETEGVKNEEKKGAEPWGKDKRERFWANMKSLAERPSMSSGEMVAGSRETVGFVQCEFIGSTASGAVTIMLERSGPCTSTLEVTLNVRASDRKSSFAAVAGEDFEPNADAVVKFAAGERRKGYQVPVFSSGKTWRAPKHFRVDLVSAKPDTVVLAGASIHRWLGKGQSCRAFIELSMAFPCGLPKEQHSSDVLLMRSYIKDRIHVRGIKFWKTLFASLYGPFHGVVVVVWVQKIMLDVACKPDPDVNNSVMVIVCAVIQLASVALLRQCNIIQVRDRGRTGGTRMAHRKTLFAKLLHLDHAEQECFDDSRWLYSAVSDVNTVTADGYWQAIVMAQNVFALFLSILMIFISAFYNAAANSKDIEGERFLPAIGIVVLVPISLFFIWLRKASTSKELQQKEHCEQQWYDTFAWLTRSNKVLYNLSSREKAGMMSHFEKESSAFVKHHQAARDLMNDSAWVTEWISQVAFVLVLIWGGFRLLNSNKAKGNEFLAGDLILLLKVYSKFGKYLVKVNLSFVKLGKASIAVRRVAELLNLPDHTSMRRWSNEGLGSDRPVSTGPGGTHKIMLHDVQLQHQNLKFQMRGGEVPEVQTGCLTRVHTVNPNGCRMAFLKLISGALTPTKGTRECASSGLMVMVPEAPVDIPHMTVTEVLTLNGADKDIARTAAWAMGLDPEESADKLHVGELKLVGLMRAIFQDPEVLVLDRPLSALPHEVKRRMCYFLRVWQQHGGLDTLLRHMMDPAKASVTPEDPAHSSCVRTLVITAEDIDEVLNTDKFLDVDQLLDSGREGVDDGGTRGDVFIMSNRRGQCVI